MFFIIDTIQGGQQKKSTEDFKLKLLNQQLFYILFDVSCEFISNLSIFANKQRGFLEIVAVCEDNPQCHLILEHWAGKTKNHADILYLQISETLGHESIISNEISKEKRNGDMT